MATPLNSLILSASVGPMLVLWFYFGYWLTIILQYNALNTSNWLASSFISFLIGIANTCAGMGKKSVREWFLENPLRFWRYFMIPFGVSSISITAGKRGEDEFFLIFPLESSKLITSLSIASSLVIFFTIARHVSIRICSSDKDEGFEERNYDGIKKGDDDNTI
ncbi:hypothetical protein TrLO_g7056 [Triparma laevis f. longispina]|uniref:Uncharacterized protein n=1 Tax=Triparma laevis f. longispina TaxID=1714387 RepID=A0A9W7FUM3_9STRA|nr:hypothetical protein TrLO_g7056 [Triparma laevis f. longispina]